jgi:hypothetical protein
MQERSCLLLVRAATGGDLLRDPPRVADVGGPGLVKLTLMSRFRDAICEAE